jgi:SSS family solute:Na+ symporter
VIWTDNIQLWVLLGGALLIPVYVVVLTGEGPLSWWQTFSQAGRTEVQVFSWDPTVRVTLVSTMLSYFLWSICTQGADQVAVQRYLSTPSVESARRSVWVYAAFKMALTALLMFAGLALFAFYAAGSGVPVAEFQQRIAPEADRILPQFIGRFLPPGASGLLLAALLAAAMSSLSSAINSISSVVSVDFVVRFGWLRDSPQLLRLDKWVAVIAGLAGIGAALAFHAAVQRLPWNLVELAGRVNFLSVGPLGVLFFSGIWLRRAGAGAVLIGFTVSAVLSVAVAFGREIFGLERSISFQWVVPTSFAGGLLAAYMAGQFRPVDRSRRETADR